MPRAPLDGVAADLAYSAAHAYTPRALEPVPGFSPGTPSAAEVDMSAIYTYNTDFDNYYGGVLLPSGEVLLVPGTADEVAPPQPHPLVLSGHAASLTRY